MGWFPADERRRLLILRYWRLALSLVCSTFSLRLSATANQPSSASTCDHQHARFNSRETGSLLKARTGRLTNSATDSCSTDPLPQLLPRWRAAERLAGPRLTRMCSFVRSPSNVRMKRRRIRRTCPAVLLAEGAADIVLFGTPSCLRSHACTECGS